MAAPSALGGCHGDLSRDQAPPEPGAGTVSRLSCLLYLGDLPSAVDHPSRDVESRGKGSCTAAATGDSSLHILVGLESSAYLLLATEYHTTTLAQYSYNLLLVQ